MKFIKLTRDGGGIIFVQSNLITLIEEKPQLVYFDENGNQKKCTYIALQFVGAESVRESATEIMDLIDKAES